MARASALGPMYVVDREVGVSLHYVTFDPWQLLPGASQEIKGEATAVNEAAVCLWGWRKGNEGMKWVRL